jgi:phage baseplate assembly protein gpV
LDVPTQEALPVVEETPADASQPEQPSSLLPDLTGMIPAIDTNGDGVIGICEAVPTEVWEMVMARSMAGEPTPFQDPSLGDGCAFDFGSDSSAAYFSYVTFATEKQFNDALASATRPEPVTTIGDSAFLNYGPDARQLWVRSGDKAVMVAIGDQENVGGMVLIAPYLLQAVVQQ